MTVKLDMAQIEALAEISTDQGELVNGIYRMVYPDVWDAVVKVNGYPTCNSATNKELFRICMAFDRRVHPEVMNGGAWMNHGFSTGNSEHLADWEVEPCPVTLKDQEEVA